MSAVSDFLSYKKNQPSKARPSRKRGRERSAAKTYDKKGVAKTNDLEILLKQENFSHESSDSDETSVKNH